MEPVECSRRGVEVLVVRKYEWVPRCGGNAGDRCGSDD